MGKNHWLTASLLTLLLLLLVVGVGMAQNEYMPLEGGHSYWYPLPQSGWMKESDGSVVMKFDTEMVTSYHHRSEVTMRMFETTGRGIMPMKRSCAEGEYAVWLKASAVEDGYLGADAFKSEWVYVCCSDVHNK